ncbi:unnamed protein product [Ambrosiozyma monospora]|uniref:ribonuclease H n=1 Tax=Ambrosiozyma monospora TaxID=43982 RepID=A0A9W7DJZ8_AMBMO|nr:unnamed protein product [Ambrosiozyma monospora]
MVYAVTNGRITGIFDDQPSLYRSVNEYPNSAYRSFNNYRDAKQYLVKNNIPTRQKRNLPTIYKIYTDGVCENNHIKGNLDRIAGYGVFFGDDDSRNRTGYIEGEKRTNNLAELTAIDVALGIIKEELNQLDGSKLPSMQYEIDLESEYAIDCITKWSQGWSKNGWVTTKGYDVQNQEVIKSILEQLKFINGVYTFYGWDKLKFDKATGEVGINGNKKAEALAKKGMKEQKRKLKAIANGNGNGNGNGSGNSSGSKKSNQNPRQRKRQKQKRLVESQQQQKNKESICTFKNFVYLAIFLIVIRIGFDVVKVSSNSDNNSGAGNTK